MTIKESVLWRCRMCIEQMAGIGPRCFTHNPTPEQRFEQEARLRWKPVLDAVADVPRELVTPHRAAWLIEAIGERSDQQEYAKKLADEISPGYAF